MRSVVAIRALLAACGLLAAALPAAAANRYAVANGNWNNSAVWSAVSGGAPGASVPVAGDDVFVGEAAARRITVPAGYAANAASLSIGSAAANGASYVTLAAATSALNVDGTVTVTAPSNNTTNYLNAGAGTLNVGLTAPVKNLNLVGGGAGNRRAELRISTGTASISGSLQVNNARARVIFSGAGNLNLGGDFQSGGTFTANSGRVTFNGSGAQSIGAYTYFNLTVTKGAGSATLAGNVTINGDFTDNGGFDGVTGGRTVTFANATARSILGTAASSSFYRLTLNKAGGLTIGHNVTATDRLTISTGRLTTGANVLSVGISDASPGTISSSACNNAGASTNRYVLGNLQRWVRAVNANTTYTFPVGPPAAGTCGRLDIRFRRVTTGQYVRVALTDGDHPQIGSAGLDPAKSVNRYWTVTNLGVVYVANPSNRMIFYYPTAGDRDAAGNVNNFIAKLYAGGAWATTVAAPVRTATTLTLNNYIGFGGFQIAEPLVVVVPGGFNAFETTTAPGAIAGVIKTKIGGVSFNLAIVALNAAKTAVETAFTGDTKIELLNAANNTGALDANGCRATWTTIQTAPTFTFAAGDLGRKNIALSEPEAWQDVRLRITYPATGAPLAIGCSADNFAIRPNVLAVAATDQDWQTAGLVNALNNTTAPGGTVHKAGQPFTLRATAYNGAATPAVTGNYAGTPTGNIASHIIPAACRNGGGCTLDVGTFYNEGGGTVRTDTATYNETGAFNLELVDAAFSNVDAADSTAVEREIRSAPTGAGRFVPDHFALEAGSAVTPACTAGGSVLSYMNQGFGVTASLVAENAAGARTWNYHSTGYAPGVVTWVAENANAGTNLGARLSGLAAAWTDGLYAVSAAGAVFARQTPDNPDGPFDSLQLGVRLVDPDGPALGGLDMNAGTAGNCVSAANCDARAIGLPSSLRFGRLSMQNAAGSDLLPLPIPLRAEYWAGAAFALNATDNCTTLVVGNLALGNWQGNLNACETSVSFVGGVTTFSAGRLDSLRLAAPGAANRGSVRLTPNLGSTGSGTTCLTTGGAPSAVTGAGRPWLFGRWDDSADPDTNANTNYDDNPSATATFGIFRDRVLFRQENF